MPKTVKTKVVKARAVKKPKQPVKQASISDVRSYQLTLVVSSKVKAEKRQDVVLSITKLIESQAGQVKSTDEWGLKDLAYAIDHELSGWYVCLAILLPAMGVAAVSQQLEREKGILRYLLIKQ